MKKFLIGILLALSGFSGARAQSQPLIEASGVQVTAGVLGAPYYVSPKNLKASGIGGTVTSISSTDGNLAITSPTTTPVINLAHSLVGVNSITAAASTDLTLNAGSGNQSVNLNPTGTGQVKINVTTSGLTPLYVNSNQAGSVHMEVTSTSGAAFMGIDSSGNAEIYTATSGKYLALGNSTKQVAFVSPGSNFLIGTSTDNSNGVLQINGSETIATGGIIDLYNTADQVTNYERIRGYWSGNNFLLEAQSGGTGVQRAILIRADFGANAININPLNTNAGGINFVSTGSSSPGDVGYIFRLNSAYTQTSGQQYGVQFNFTYNQTSGNASNTDLLVNRTITGGTNIGSGTQLLADFQVGSVSKANLDSLGNILAKSFGIINPTQGVPEVQSFYTFYNDGATGIAWAGSSQIKFDNNAGATMFLVNSGAVSVFGKVASYNGVSTAGWGVPAVQSAAQITAQSAAATIATYTVGAADGSFEVSANMNVSAVTVLSTTLTVTYTDESNTARTMILPVQQLTGSFIAGGLITGTGAWETPEMNIRCKASTVITVKTATGTFTGVTYSAGGVIAQIQ